MVQSGAWQNYNKNNWHKDICLKIGYASKLLQNIFRKQPLKGLNYMIQGQGLKYNLIRA